MLKSTSKKKHKRRKPREWWRQPGRISVDEAQQGYDYFRIVPPHDCDNAEYRSALSRGRRTAVERPRRPRYAIEGEDKTIPRVSLAPSIWAAIAGATGKVSAASVRRFQDEDICSRVHCWHIYGVRAKDVPALKTDIRRYVPDARLTGEVWSTQPVQLEYIGIIGGDYEDRNSSSIDAPYSVWVCPAKKQRARKSTENE